MDDNLKSLIRAKLESHGTNYCRGSDGRDKSHLCSMAMAVGAHNFAFFNFF
jgi:hypothetical protein